MCLRESDIENIKTKRLLMARSNLAPNYDDIHAHIWSLWIDEENEEQLRTRAREGNVEILRGKDLFYIDGKSIFEDN